MKPGWARHILHCRICPNLIVVGSQKLTDNIYSVEKRVIRVHYHIPCYTGWLEKWFGENVYVPKRDGGRAPLRISSTARIRRIKLLNRLSYLRRCRLPGLVETQQQVLGIFHNHADNIEAATLALAKLDKSKLSTLSALQAETRAILLELSAEELGGIPERYR